jgi:hypothetical protein
MLVTMSLGRHDKSEFRISNFDFRVSLGGKSAAQQLRGRHTALGGFGKWVVGSLK